MLKIFCLSLNYINISSTTNVYGLFLLGSYYGFLNTLPCGPSQLLFIRTFLLADQENQNTFSNKNRFNQTVIASLSGIILSQLLIVLSIYSSSIYTYLIKPHTFSILILPYILWCWNRIKEYQVNEFVDRPTFLINKINCISFIDSFFFGIFNSVVFPNPTFNRLIHLFLFRYSNVFSFIIGTVLGYSSGMILFVVLNSLLLSRIKKDTPIVYNLLKRIIHNIFPPLFFALFLTYLGRSPYLFLIMNLLMRCKKHLGLKLHFLQIYGIVLYVR